MQFAAMQGVKTDADACAAQGEGGGESMDTAYVRAKIKAVGRERKRRGGGRKGRCTVFIYTLLRKVLRERFCS